MAAQMTSPSLLGQETQQANRLQRLVLFIIFLVCGLAILVFGSNYFEIFPTNKNLTYNVILSAVFLVAALCLRRNENWNRYWQIAYAFFVASTAFPITLLLSGWSNVVLGWFNVTTATSQGIAIAKVYEMILVIIPILVLTKLSGADLGSIYLKRGDLKLSLGIGCGYLIMKTDNIWGATLIHAAADLFAFIALLANA